jgi:hypothetical protein
MSTKPIPNPPAETHWRQTTYLVGAAALVAAVIAGVIVADRIGASRDENRRGRSNENPSQERRGSD